MHPDDAAPDLYAEVPDPAVLKRRLLLAAVVSFTVWIAALVLLDALGLGPWFALLAAVVVYAAVVRPMMRPVRDAVALRRRLAYQAFLEQRDEP